MTEKFKSRLSKKSNRRRESKIGAWSTNVDTLDGWNGRRLEEGMRLWCKSKEGKSHTIQMKKTCISNFSLFLCVCVCADAHFSTQYLTWHWQTMHCGCGGGGGGGACCWQHGAGAGACC